MKQIEKRFYWAIHKWLRITFGRASKCEQCKTKTSSKYEWALKKGYEYKKDKSCFIELCSKCHINYDYTDKRRENQSVSQTKRFSFKKERTKMRKSAHKKEICQLNIFGEVIKTFPSIREAELITGIHSSCISRVCNNKRKKAGGYKWQYKTA